MAKIAVFDSGLGSLSIIKEMQKVIKAEIIYFGDQKNFPYGNKSKSELQRIISKSIKVLRDNFSPDLIVVGSNTPTIVLDLEDGKIIGVRPPLRVAERISKTKNIGILATKSAVQSKEMARFIEKSKLGSNTKIHKINGSELVELVESGKFLMDKSTCMKIIKERLERVLLEKNIDVVTLSSTHMPFLKPLLKSQFPKIQFIDPANLVAKKIHKKIKDNQEKRNRLRIYSSGDVKKFQNNLFKLGIKNKVNFLST